MMLTKLPITISTIEEAKAFLNELHKNGEAYHPDDEAFTVINADGFSAFTETESQQLDKLMDEVLAIDNFDPYSYLLELSQPIEDNTNITISNDYDESSITDDDEF